MGGAIDGANRHDSKLVEPTLDAIRDRGLHWDIDTVHLDKGYDYRFVEDLIAQAGIDDANIARKKKRGEPETRRPYRIDTRWVVERTNSWFEAFGQLRRNTDRKLAHRAAQFALAIVTLITARLIDWRDRYSLQPAPIR